MDLAALVLGLIACVAIIALGIRFLLQPRQATLDFGIAADSLRGLTEIKGAPTSPPGWSRSWSGRPPAPGRWAGCWSPRRSRQLQTR